MAYKDHQYNPFFRQLLFLGVLIFIGIIIFTQLRFFLGAFLGAFTIYVVLRTPLFYLIEKRKWRPWIASTVLVLATTVILLLLSYLIFRVVASEIPSVDASSLLYSIREFINEINEKIGFNIVPENILLSVQGYLTRFVSTAINTTYSFAANILLMLLVLYFMLARGRKMECKIADYVPFRGKSLQLLKHEAKGMIYSNAVGIPIIMIGQGLVSCLIYWLLGVNQFVFWAFLTGIAGLIPVVGTGIVWLPIAVFLMVSGHIWGGVILILYGVIIISNTDNVLRIILMKKAADTHPLIVIFGVILGIPLFGFWGIIFGPLFISGFLLLIKIYFWEYELITPSKCTPGTIEDELEEQKTEITP